MGQSKNIYAGRQQGFSLLVALIFVTFFGAVLATFVYDRSDVVLRDEAGVTGWQAAKIARASRIYVRNQLSANPNLKYVLDIAGSGPQVIPLGELMAASLLPSDFAVQGNGAFLTALGQEITVIMANYPVDGDPNLDSTVPTAYVYLRDSDRSNASLVQQVVQAIRREDVAIAAPVFNGTTNISGDCNGMGDAVVIWDSGCMGTIEFAALTGDATFEPGSLVVPSWRAVNFDTRVLMRYPQPEVSGMNTMLTELEMGDPLADCETNAASRISVPSDAAGITDLCGSMNDDVTAVNDADADRRRDIINTRNLSGNSYIAYQQTGNDVVLDNETGTRTNAATDESHSFDVTGNLTATGDAKAFDGDITVTGTTTLDRNIIVPTRIGQDVTANIGGVLTANGMTSDNLEVFNTVITPAAISANTVNAVPAANITSSLTTSVMQMNTAGATVNVATDADLLGITEAQTTAISGASGVGSYSYVAGNLNVQNMMVTGNVNIADTAVVAGQAAIGTLNVSNAGGDAQCAGDCPGRIEYCEQNGGALGFDCCMRNVWNDNRYVCVSDGGI